MDRKHRMAQQKLYPRSADISLQEGVPIESDPLASFFQGIKRPLPLPGTDLGLLRFPRQAAQMFQLKASAAGARISTLKLKVPGLAKLAAQVLRTQIFSET